MCQVRADGSETPPLALEALVIGHLLQALGVDTRSTHVAGGYSTKLEWKNQVFLMLVFGWRGRADFAIKSSSPARGTAGNVVDTGVHQLHNAIDQFAVRFHPH